MDLPTKAWHSRWMRDRFSARRLFLIILLSQAMAIQALLLAWSGTQLIAGDVAGGFASLCYGAPAGRNTDGTKPAPTQPDAHHVCLGACLAGHVATNPPDPTVFQSRPAIHLRMMVSRQMMPLSNLRVLAFHARAPPGLI